MKFKQEILSFIVALQYFTIIPIRNHIKIDPEYNSIVYFPLIGIIIGILDLLFFKFLFVLIDNIELSIISLMIFHTFLTGGLHEDGLSDFFDGFGGGYTKQKVLEIMKDPHIGNFGVLSITYSIILKFIMLNYIYNKYNHFEFFIVVYLLAQYYSRWIILYFVKFLPYARIEGKSKVFEKISYYRFWFFQVFYFLLLLFFLYYYSEFIIFILYIFLIIISIYYIFKIILMSKINGYTGDTLGAIQQITELLFYFFTIIFYNNFDHLL